VIIVGDLEIPRRGDDPVQCYTSHISEPFRLVVDSDGEPALEVKAGRLTFDELAALSRCLEGIPVPRASAENDLAV